MVDLHEVVSYSEEFLQLREIQDWPHALNGLQIENAGVITQIGAAVDVSLQTLSAAAEKAVDFLIVHHGLFWRGLSPVTGALRQKISLALDGNIALFSAHLPLDLHPQVGNNQQLAAALQISGPEPFLEVKGRLIGLRADVDVPRDELMQRMRAALGSEARLLGGGPETVRRVGLITGGAGSEIYQMAGQGIDTFITGEAPHWAAVAAADAGINLIAGGHYATETFGVKALAAHLAAKFSLPWQFIDAPTGL